MEVVDKPETLIQQPKKWRDWQCGSFQQHLQDLTTFIRTKLHLWLYMRVGHKDTSSVLLDQTPIQSSPSLCSLSGQSIAHSLPAGGLWRQPTRIQRRPPQKGPALWCHGAAFVNVTLLFPWTPLTTSYFSPGISAVSLELATQQKLLNIQLKLRLERSDTVKYNNQEDYNFSNLIWEVALQDKITRFHRSHENSVRFGAHVTTSTYQKSVCDAAQKGIGTVVAPIMKEQPVPSGFYIPFPQGCNGTQFFNSE